MRILLCVGRFAADMAGDYKSSFAINLFPDGFSLDITSEVSYLTLHRQEKERNEGEKKGMSKGRK